MSYPAPPAGQPPSFKTNVNRAKTKRWVEAKSYSYDGDDWGEMDEYDEYGGYDEPPPPSKPTGLRQRGQSANREQQDDYQPPQGAYNNPEASQHGYGNIGRQGPVQQSYGARSATNPSYQTQLARSGSFDQGDERRAFSATMPQQGMPPTQSEVYQSGPYVQAPNTQVQYYPTGAPTPQTQPNQQGPPPTSSSDYPRHPGMGSRTQSMASNASADFHNRRDFSPSAVPPPLHTRGSPSPQTRPDTQSAWRPPRKSSMGQQNQPEYLYDDHGFGAPAAMDVQSTERTASDSGKPLPFVRPADIYKRMQEEKERERQSQDSSRPSMDAILDGNKTRDDPRRDSGGASDRSQDVETRQRSRSTLDPVAERKSEYGMPGLPRKEVDSRDEARQRQPAVNEAPKVADARKLQDSLSPQLPDVARMSGFGELFAGTAQPAKDSSDLGSTSENTHQPLPDEADTSLQHQPSLGFRSVVHQAFDATHEQIPETPSSSTADSSLGRSGSGGTSVVSPIISRGPSSATQNLSFREPQIRPATPPPPVNTTLDTQDRPQSSSSLGTPKALTRKASPDPASQRRASFMPGHRRDLSTPSPDNSPARTPALEANKQLQEPQAAELAMTTPIQSSFPQNHGQYDYPPGSQPSPVKLQGFSGFPMTDVTTAGLPEKTSGSPSRSLAEEMPKSPAESTRSRVRNLADKFESGRSSPAGSERAASPVKTSFLPNQNTNQSRPLPSERLESFRPKLPGGWESSVSLAPLAVSSMPEPSATPIPLEQRLQSPVKHGERSSTAILGHPDSRNGISREEESRSSQERDEAPSSDPFASLTAAGSALAGAFSAAMGSDKDEKDKSSPKEPESQLDHQPGMAANEDPRLARPRNASVNTAFIPEASKPATLATPDDEASSIMPTPLDKLAQPTQSGNSKAGDYFAAHLIPKQQVSGDSYTTQDSTSTKRSQLLSTLSTDTLPQYESDRLRREIIQELSPRFTSEPSAAESITESHDGSRQSAGPGLDPQQRESLVIPREYDSYWNNSGSEQSSRASSVKGPSKAVRDARPQYVQNQSDMLPAIDNSRMPPTSAGEAQASHEKVSGTPAMSPRHFSWEGPSETVSIKQEPLSSEPPPNDNTAHRSILRDSRGQMPVNTEPRADQQTLPTPIPEPYSGNVRISSGYSVDGHSMGPQTGDPSSDKMTVAHPGMSEPSHLPEQTNYGGPRTFAPGEPPSSIADGGLQPGEGPIGYQDVPGSNEDPVQCMTATESLPPLPQPSAAQPKTQSFREILALKDPRDRINAYNENRAQYANVDTGLAHWLAVTAVELPEHKDVLPNGRLLGTVSYKPPTTRTKLGSLLPGSSSTQQPYYQQYLNASSPAGSAADGSTVAGNNSPQTYSPTSGAGKLSSQQMQARGKDLLHSAGVFGGKANVAAKGLFSKGRSRFRGGNADKAPISNFNPHHPSSPQQQVQSTKSTPNTPHNESFPEKPESPQQSVGDRPKSLGAASRYQTQETSVQETHNQSLTQPLSLEHHPNHDVINAKLSNVSSRDDVADQSPIRRQTSLRDTTQTASAAKPATHSNLSKDLNLASNHLAREVALTDRPKDAQSPVSLTSNNRTPTQADYVDYFRRGSSPTAMIPQTKTTDSNDPAFEGNSVQQSSISSQMTEFDSPPNLKSKYSVQSPGEATSIPPDQVYPERGDPHPNDGISQRDIEDPGKAFQTAESGPRTYLATAESGSPQNITGHDQNQSTEDLVSETSSEAPTPSEHPMAVPAANFQDQLKARPFSFVQFSKSPVLRPFEDYSHREPSIDSTASTINPDQDVPPSPISPPRSVSHSRADKSASKSFVQQSVDHPSVDSNGQRFSGLGSQPFGQLSQSSSLQDHPAFHREKSSGNRDEALVSEYPASTSRQETVNPRQQSTEYSLEGVGPPPGPRTVNSTSTSKRGSRSSAFFKSFKVPPTDPASPPQPSENERQDDTDSLEKSKMHKTKSKRGSLFRSLTGAAKNNSSDGTLEEAKNVTHPAVAQNVPQPAADTRERNDSPAKSPTKYRNRLSRAATAKMEEQQKQDPSKRNRFSGIGSLFGRSKDRRRSNAGLDRSQQVTVDQMQRHDSGQSQSYGSHLSPSVKLDHGSIILEEKGASRDDPYQYTGGKLARGGFLTPNPLPRSSKASEPSPSNQDSKQSQQQFPPRQQSLGPGTQRSEPRPSDWSREQSSSSANIRPPSSVAPVQQHRVQSSFTTRSTTRHSGLKQSDSNPRQFSSTTTTVTTTSRTPNQIARQQSLGNNFSRSDSPPPPPPPPKDTWHQSKSHQRSMSGSSFSQAVRGSNDYPSRTIHKSSNDKTYYTDAGQQASTLQSNHSNPPSSDLNRQSLHPLQTNIPSPPSRTGGTDGAADTRQQRRSQMEGMGTPKAEQVTLSPSAVTAASAPAGRRSMVEGEDEPIVMSATSFPGQEWQPSSFARWEGD
ncbi:MAG: hypothetical protein Q9170_004559 [Blastenia crenularia]